MRSRTARTEGARAGRRKPAEKGRRKAAKPEAAETDKRWSARVTRESNAMDLEPGVFKLGSSRAIAASLKRSSEASPRRKADAFRSAMSMLNFYINRAGRNLSGARLGKLDGAKRELRRLFGKTGTTLPAKGRTAKGRAASRARPGAGSARGRRGAR